MAVALAICLQACGDATGPELTPVGSWRLVAVDGAALPVVLFEDANTTISITSGSRSIRSDGACSVTLTTLTVTRTSLEETEERTEEGTRVCVWWEDRDGSVVFTFEDGTRSTGDLFADRLEVRRGETRLTYR